MRIKLLKQYKGYKEGDIVEVVSANAWELIRRGIARKYASKQIKEYRDKMMRNYRNK